MKNSVSSGAIVLIISGLISKIFGAFFRLPLTNILKIQGIGIFQMIMALYSLTLGFVSTGVTNALSKLVSGARARGEVSKIGGFYRYALIFSMGISLFLGIIFIIFSKQISSLQGFSDASISYMLLALLLPLGALIGTFRGIIQGYENMVPTAVSQIIEQASKFAFGLFFAYLFGRNSISAGVFGAFLGITISEVLAVLYLFFLIAVKIKIKVKSAPVRAQFFKAVLPLTFTGSVLPLASAIESLTIVTLLSKAGLPQTTATTLYGIQTGVVGAILHFPLIISLSVAMALLPKISFLSAKGQIEDQQKIIKKAFGIMWFLLIPLVIGIISVSKIVFPIIYPTVVDGYMDIIYQLTVLGGFSIALSALMQMINAILQAKGFYNQSLLFNIIGAVFKIVTLVVFAPVSAINIYAIPISNIVLYSIVCICGLIKLGSLVKVSFFSFALPLLSALIMFMIINIWLSYFSSVLGVIGAIVLGGIIYLVLCFPLLKEYARDLIQKRRRAV